MGFEFRKGSFKERLHSLEEVGYVMGVNGVSFPEDAGKVVGEGLYGTPERSAGDRYLLARFREEWCEGSMKRIASSREAADVAEAAALQECIKAMHPVNEAFRLGSDYRFNGRSALWMADAKLFELMDGKTEEDGQMYVDAWIAGWHFMDEEIGTGNAAGKPKRVLYRINADKLEEFERCRDREDTPEDGGALRYFDIYCDAADRLVETGGDDFVGCLTCPYAYRGLGVTIDDHGRGDWCDMDCASASEVLHDTCGDGVSELYGYFVEKVEEEEGE